MVCVSHLSMASHRDTPAPVTLVPSTTDEDSTFPQATNRSSSFWRNRFSNASLSSVRTLPPQYSVVDTLEEPPTLSPISDGITDNGGSGSLLYSPSSWSNSTSSFPLSQSAIEPPRYSLLHPRQSLVLTRRFSTDARFESEGDPQAHEFRYSYPIRQKNPWATLHLHTRDGIPGNSTPLQNQPRVPRLWSCDPITGTLHLDLDSPQNIQEVKVMVWFHIALR
jgi:hypothetical protein